MQLSRQVLPYADTASFPSIFLDYISGNSKLDGFYAYRPEAASFKTAIADLKKRPYERKLLADILAGQNPGKKAKAALLADENTFTVCTGHQLCIFTGPLFFIYKIISTLNLAGRLSKLHPEYNFIPVYWMAAEDHDFGEIDHIYLPGKKMEWGREEAIGQGQPPAGDIATASLARMLDELRGFMGDNRNGLELMEIFRKSYLEQSNLADATRKLVEQLFPDSSLLILDARDKRLKKLFSGVMKDDLIHHHAYRILSGTNALLEEKGYKPQVNPREINLFRMAGRDRIRIDSYDEGYVKEMEEDPERFSPNVVLRPLYQQLILPNLAYVGGPGELAYWLQYRKVFEHYKVFYPLLVPRNSALWLDARSVQLMRKLNLSYAELFEPLDSLTRNITKRNSGSGLSLDEEAARLKQLFAGLAEKARGTDPTLAASVEAELQKTLNGLRNIESKLLRAEKHKQETTLNQAAKLKEKLFPQDRLQERHDNFIPFYLKHGRAFFEMLIENMDPLELEFLVLAELTE
ncbi:MAG: bacillithiol biosynthesis cysteine-adding enzyme BshC [Bacteroidota bacterium]